MKCQRCEHNSFNHLIFVLQCQKCGEIAGLPKEDKTGVDFLVQRYTAPTEDNAPGKDTEFEVKTVKG